MFNLFRSREKMVRIFLSAILLVLAASMLLYLIPQYNTGTSTSDDVLAVVGNDSITLSEAQKVVQSSLRNRQLPPEILPNFVPQMVDDMITRRALVYEAERLGFTVSDADLRDTIRRQIPNLFPRTPTPPCWRSRV